MKKFLSIFICIMVLFTLLSTTAFAEETRTFTIVVTPEEGGLVSDSFGNSANGPRQYTYEDMVVFVASAKQGYHFTEWKYDNVSKGKAPSYTFLVDADHTLKAVFEKHSFTYKSDANGHWEECSCGEKNSTSQKHTSKKINEKAATENSEGYTGDTVCSVCSYVIEQGEAIPAKTSTTSKNSGTASSSYQGTTSSKTSSASTQATSSKNSTSSTKGTTSTQTNNSTVGTTSTQTNNSTVDTTVSDDSILTVGETSSVVTDATSSETETSKGNNTVLYVIIAVAAVVLIGLVVAAILLFTKKDKDKITEQEK